MQSSSVGPDEIGEDERLVEPAAEAERWKWFGVWLAERRLMQGLTKKQVAEKAEISVSTLSTLEAGGRVWKGQWIMPSPAAVTLVKIATALQVDSDDVFDRAGRTSPTGTAATATSEPSIEVRLSQLEDAVRELRGLLHGTPDSAPEPPGEAP